MSTALAQIDRDALWDRIRSGHDFVLVDARSPMSFALAHLPGAVNLTRRWADERASWYIRGLDSEVVVYCENLDCDASVVVASRLVELGYRNVADYPGGKEDWTAAGLPLEGARESRRPA